MRNFLKFVSKFSIIGTIATYPKTALATMLTLGAGSVGVAIILTTPTITPQPSSYFNANSANGQTNIGLKPNGGLDAGTVESLGFPNPVQNSLVLYVEGSVSPGMGYATFESESVFGGGMVANSLSLTANTVGLPTFFAERNDGGGVPGSQWWNALSTNTLNGSFTTALGTNYATGYYPFTATGGGCAREPTGVRTPTGTVLSVDPGFLCSTAPTVNLASIPGSGAQQPTGTAASPAQAATTCTPNSPVSGSVTITAHLAVAHGIAPGQTFALGGFPTVFSTNYTALNGTGGTTLVGAAAINGGSCTTPVAFSGEGTALSGTGGSIGMIPISTTNPFSTGATGITTKNGQHFCGIIGEYGADSSFPGAQFASFVDDRGNALPGAPALVPWLNQGTANFTGYTTFGTQSPSSPALTVTAMNPYSIIGATWISGQVTFITTASPGFIPGSEFTVTGSTPAGYNQTYVAVAGTSGTLIVANPLSGPGGVPQALSNPSGYSGGASMVSVIMPNMQVLGMTGGLVIAPYGTFGGTGTGGVGTYGLVGNPSTTALTAKIDNGSGASGNTLTTTSGGSSLVVGSAISGSGVTAGTIVTAVLGTNSFTVNNAQLVASESMTNAGTIGSSSAPVTIFAFPNHYFSATPGTTSANPYGGVTTARSQSLLGDMWGTIGSTKSTNGTAADGWGGALANMSMMWGVFPQVTGGAPDTTALASLCKKTTDIQTFAAANSLTVHSLYRLNDLGIWGDSSNATITGYIDGATNTAAGTATLHVLTTPYGSLAPPANQTATIAAPGLAGVPLSAPTISLLSSGATATYTVQFATGITSANLGSSGSPVTFSVGAFKPALPIATSTINGYIDGDGTTGHPPTLHVTSLPTTGNAQFTGVLGNTFTGHIDNGTIGTVGNLLTVTATPTTGYPIIGVGTVITGGTTALTTPMTVTAVLTQISGPGLTGTYTVSGTAQATGATGAMFGSGILPAAANDIQVSSVTGTIATGMLVSDGGVNIAPTVPILIGATAPATGGATNWAINPTYYPANITNTGLTGTMSTLVPGQYVQGATASVGLTTPVSIIGYGTGTGGVGTYLLSNAASNGIGSAGSPAAFSTTGIGDAGAVAPGPALTIRDQGAGVAFPVTNYTAETGTITVDGTFDTSVLGGMPTTIQAQVSLTSGGAPVAGCSACAWTNLSGYSATLRSGTIYDWRGQVLNIPASSAPLFVSVRAANGQAYATMPGLIKVGLIFDWMGEGQTGALSGNEGGSSISSFVGFWGLNSWFGAPAPLDQGPPVLGAWVPAQTIMAAGDRFGVLGAGLPLSEGIGNYEQLLTNSFGWPVVTINSPRDGIGITPEIMGGMAQSQTVGVGDGTTTTWCSAVTFCASAGVSGAGPLYFSAGVGTGATLAGASVSGTTLSIPAGNQTFTTPNTSGVVLGALEPGFILNTGPVLDHCLTGCAVAAYGPIYGSASLAQTWALNCSGSCLTTAPTRAEPPAGAPWPSYNIQGIGSLASGIITSFGEQLIQAGTFKVTVNGTVVCQDTSTFAYNVQSGTCAGAGIASSFVNYATGDYSITWTTAPTGPIIASWTNIISPDTNTSNLSRAPGFDFFGNGSAQSGPMSSIMAKTPGGVSAHMFAGGSSDDKILSQQGFQFGGPGYTQAISWLYATRFPSLIPGQTATTPFISANPWRGEGPAYFNGVASGNQAASYGLSGQWSVDVATKSTFTGTIAGGVLTLTAAASGPMWEGEVVDCVTVSGSCPLGPSSGIYISSLASGSWGASGSTYNLVGSPANVSTASAMQNAVYYTGPGPAFYSGTMNDVPVQSGGLAGTSGYGPHMANGPFAGRRVAARWAALTWGGLTNPANASDPSLDRTKANASGCDTAALADPCFDVGNTFAASHSGTISGAQITVTGGIAAHDRPFVVGQLLTCSGCTTGRFITSIDVPPSQSTTTGAGEVGQTFHITANASLLTGPTTETVTAGCSGTSGTGSNCIDIAFKAGTTNGTYATAWALATCGENHLNGPAPPYAPPSGVCQTNGIGSLVRAFRIGTAQAMWGLPLPVGNVAGSPYDDGADPLNTGSFNQSLAFTCNIVSAKVVQCVKGNLYDATAHTLTSIGQWASGSTFVEYGDSVLGTSRIASMQGHVGGQPFPLTAGSGGTNGSTIVTATGCTTTTGFVLPKMDVTISGGALVNAYPSSETTTPAMGSVLGGGCAFAPATGTGTISTPPTGPPDGQGGIATYGTDSNMMGDLLYDNSGLPGNPLNSFFTNNMGGYWESGLPVIPFGGFMGLQVSG